MPETFSPPLKAAVPLEVSVLPRPRFKPPPAMFNEATLLANPEASSVPPLTVIAELGESALAAPAASTPPLTVVAPL